MKGIAESYRLILRPFTTGDAQALFDLNNDPEVLRYTGDKAFSSIAESLDFIKSYSAYTEHGYGRWAVLDKMSGTFLGWNGLKKNSDGVVDLGFRFFKNQWNKGYATESSLMSLHLGFQKLQLSEIIGRTSISNVASIKVLEKIGMDYIKTADYDYLGKTNFYAIKKKGYQAQSTSKLYIT